MVVFRLLAFFTLLVFSGQTVLPALHHALLAHEVCAEHGDLVHAGHTEEHGHGEPEAASPPNSDEYERQVQALENGAHAHDHCAACAAFRVQDVAFLHGHVAFVESPVAVLAPAARVFDVYARDGVALYGLAPKQGPPSVG